MIWVCKSSSISFPTSWKRHKFCKVFNAFVILIELGFTTGYVIFFTDVIVWGPFSQSLTILSKPDVSLKAWHFSQSLMFLSKPDISWFIRKPHSNVWNSWWETAQRWLKGPRKLLNIVTVWDSRVRDTERICKRSQWECWTDQIKSSR